MSSSWSCPSDWVIYEDKCFKASNKTGNFTEAKEQCEQEGAYLASIGDAEEQMFIGNLTLVIYIYTFFSVE